MEPTRLRGKKILILGSADANVSGATDLSQRHTVLTRPLTGSWPEADVWIALADTATDGPLRHRVEAAHPAAPVIVLDDRPDVEAAREWLRWGATDYLPITAGRWPVERIEETLASLETPIGVEVGELPAEREQDFCDDLERVLTFIDGIRDGVVFVDAGGTVIAVNRSFERQLGLPTLASVGARVETLVGPGELTDGLVEGFSEVLRGGAREWNQEVLLAGTGDETLVLDVTVLALSATERAPSLGAVAIVRDVSAVRRSERMKTQFLSIVSHELRAPLTAIRTFVSMLCQGRLGEVLAAQQRVLEDIRDQSIRLDHEIDKIINLARLESEDFERGDEEFALRDLIQMACRDFRGAVEVKGMSLHLELPTPEVRVRADFEDLKRALRALVENAIKFTAPGGDVTVSCATSPSEAVLSVTDTGIGIAARYHGLIFEKFQQVESPLTRQFGGAGLGLSVARRIVRAHDSDIKIESEPGRGTVFSFRLPRTRVGVPALGAEG